ncbi:MAG TPA: diphthine synthase [Candidatus Altiarchaeales archaeon]|nr:diphthine synthase [Candidatus Altiarchaeales archaeon]
MLYLIGLGISDEKDLSLRGFEILKAVDKIYAEFYTSSFSATVDDIEKLLDRKITILSREDIEENLDETILREAYKKNIALLTPGDPMIATTHSALILSARKSGILTRIIHSSSIYSSIAETGLQIYKFGKTTTIPFPEKGYLPTSPYDVLKTNLDCEMHTLLLLDIRMTIDEATDILLKMEKDKREGIIKEDILCIGVARLGSKDSVIKYGRLKDIHSYDFGKPPHALIIPGKLHFMEEEFLDTFIL